MSSNRKNFLKRFHRPFEKVIKSQKEFHVQLLSEEEMLNRLSSIDFHLKQIFSVFFQELEYVLIENILSTECVDCLDIDKLIECEKICGKQVNIFEKKILYVVYGWSTEIEKNFIELISSYKTNIQHKIDIFFFLNEFEVSNNKVSELSNHLRELRNIVYHGSVVINKINNKDTIRSLIKLSQVSEGYLKIGSNLQNTFIKEKHKDKFLTFDEGVKELLRLLVVNSNKSDDNIVAMFNFINHNLDKLKIDLDWLISSYNLLFNYNDSRGFIFNNSGSLKELKRNIFQLYLLTNYFELYTKCGVDHEFISNYVFNFEI